MRVAIRPHGVPSRRDEPELTEALVPLMLRIKQKDKGLEEPLRRAASSARGANFKFEPSDLR
jgi:hypothetical protein